MEIALHVGDFTAFGTSDAIGRGLRDTVEAAEQAGFATLTLMDHWFQMESAGSAADPMLEGYTALGFLAAHSARIELGLLVTGVTYRHPGLLAKTVATLDVLSGGRAMLGIGAAWYEREHLGLGIRFPPTWERFERLEETLRVCRQMWGPDDGPFIGHHYRLAETLCRPAPLHPGGPPILVGGMGERKTLRLAARYADACNLFDAGPDVVAHKLDVLRSHCEDLGRAADAVSATVITATDPLDGTDAFLRSMQDYASLGVSKVWVGSRGPDLPAWVEQVGRRVVPALSSL